jgi:hypothetical protein
VRSRTHLSTSPLSQRRGLIEKSGTSDVPALPCLQVTTEMPEMRAKYSASTGSSACAGSGRYGTTHATRVEAPTVWVRCVAHRGLRRVFGCWSWPSLNTQAVSVSPNSRPSDVGSDRETNLSRSLTMPGASHTYLLKSASEGARGETRRARAGDY